MCIQHVCVSLFIKLLSGLRSDKVKPYILIPNPLLIYSQGQTSVQGQTCILMPNSFIIIFKVKKCSRSNMYFDAKFISHYFQGQISTSYSHSIKSNI